MTYKILVEKRGWITPSGYVVQPRLGWYDGLSGNGRQRRPKLKQQGGKVYRTMPVAMRVMASLAERFPQWEYDVVVSLGSWQ